MKGLLAIFVIALAAAAYAGQCPSEQAEDWEIELLLPHEDCNKYYKCTYGEPVPQHCPSGLYYNIKYKQCDWKANVDCGDRNVDQPEPEPESEEQSEPELELEEQRPPKPKPQPPKPKPPKPQPPKPKPQPPKPKPQPESESEEIEFLENGCPVSPHVHWLLPSEEDCNQFYYCVFGEKQVRQCPSSLHFNVELQVCDWPWDAGCQLEFNRRLPVRPTLLDF